MSSFCNNGVGETIMAVSKKQMRRIKTACHKSARGLINQASTGTGRVSLARRSARAKGLGSRVAWSTSMPRPRL
jgi:hypothetical protein